MKSQINGQTGSKRATRASNASSKRKIDTTRHLLDEVDSDEEILQASSSKMSRTELVMDPNECKLPHAQSLWKLKKTGQNVHVSILPPIGIQFSDFKFKVLPDSATLHVLFKWPEEFTDGEVLCDYSIKEESSKITEYHPKVAGYDYYF